MNGIDVSRHNGVIDWKKVKADGIDFAMCKASQGSPLSDPSGKPFSDTRFADYIRGATAAGVHCGAYHYLTGTDEKSVESETRYFLKTLEPYRDSIVYPVACDIEENRYKKLPRELNSRLFLKFAELAEDAGYIPVLYTNLSFYKSYYDVSLFQGYDIWFARYYAVPSPVPKPDIQNLTIFQWNSKGRVDGISGNVDLNVGYYDYARDAIREGSMVRVKTDAVRYWPGGPRIPEYVKGSAYSVGRDTNRGKEVFKGGSKCVLLSGINTWTDIDNLILL